ncbi:alpha/beta fold hydrolase [Nocardioides mangrovi]|uniref:Alpha/beta hydrolase n=1 Tax=Nocardioides mangrovi TaxID=2874580 RepID=A0ABS7UGZ7_9ACTN|nr:alpha/beta hydrolase [Nocardioides mangrovi]MBZ5740319.1 alpha/beta hydrolase [Nocardioides mangrovi]
MPYIKVGQENSGDIELYYEDHGSGTPIVLIHGYPLSGTAWEKQLPVLLELGHRVITYDRRGFGRSSRPADGYDYDTFAADLRTLMETLDLRGATLVGHSMGTGEVVRYLGVNGSDRVDKAVLISPIPPYLLVRDDGEEGAPASLFAGFVEQATGDRLAYLRGFLENFYNYDVNRGTLVSEAVFDASFAVAADSSSIAGVACITAWTTDFRDDVARVDVPVLVIHGNQDRVLPIELTAARLPGLMKDAELVVVDGGPHAIAWTHADQVTTALTTFLG